MCLTEWRMVEPSACGRLWMAVRESLCGWWERGGGAFLGRGHARPEWRLPLAPSFPGRGATSAEDEAYEALGPSWVGGGGGAGVGDAGGAEAPGAGLAGKRD